jgi:hypothetical protein
MAEARRVIRQGQMLALPLAASGLFPPMLVEMVHIGEESGALDGMLSRTADFYEGELTFYPGPAELSHRAGAHCLRGDLRGHLAALHHPAHDGDLPDDLSVQGGPLQGKPFR